MEIFEVLADPTRRRILELLADGDRSAGQLQKEFSLSQPAVSKHLRVLREAGVVASRPAGQRRVYRLDPECFRDVEIWVAKRRRAWSARLDRLGDHLAARKRRKGAKA